MTMAQLNSVWLNFIHQVQQIHPQSARILHRKYKIKFMKDSEKFAHADSAEILRRLFSWGAKGSIERKNWVDLYIALGGTNVPVDMKKISLYPGD